MALRGLLLATFCDSSIMPHKPDVDKVFSVGMKLELLRFSILPVSSTLGFGFRV